MKELFRTRYLANVNDLQAAVDAFLDNCDIYRVIDNEELEKELVIELKKKNKLILLQELDIDTLIEMLKESMKTKNFPIYDKDQKLKLKNPN